MKGKWIYYDPDFRREPKMFDPSKHYCETCYRVVESNKAVRVETYNDFPVGTELQTAIKNGLTDYPPYEMTARESDTGTRYIGRDCWKRIVNEFGFEN